MAESGAVAEDGFVAITVQCCELPRYMNRALFRKADLSGSGEVRFQEFERIWETLVETCPDEISMVSGRAKERKKKKGFFDIVITFLCVANRIWSVFSLSRSL